MVVANSSSSTTALVKAVMLPMILVLLAGIAAGASSTEDVPAVVKAGGRFSETPMGRKLLNLQLCGPGSAPNYNCAAILPLANIPACCTDFFGNKACWDVGSILRDKCGSCTTTCPLGSVCCSGVCANLLTDKNNCGFCKRKCPKCKLGFCAY